MPPAMSNPTVAKVAGYPHTRYLECRRCRTMTLHDAVDATGDERYMRLLWGVYRCLACSLERRETLSVKDYRAVAEKLKEA